MSEYNDFEDSIKTDWGTDEEEIRHKNWLGKLDMVKINSTPYETLSLAYDKYTKEFVFLTYENVENGDYRYGTYNDLMQDERHEIDGSSIPYPHGFEDIEDVMKYLNDMNYVLNDWVENELREFALSV